MSITVCCKHTFQWDIIAKILDLLYFLSSLFRFISFIFFVFSVLRFFPCELCIFSAIPFSVIRFSSYFIDPTSVFLVLPAFFLSIFPRSLLYLFVLLLYPFSLILSTPSTPASPVASRNVISVPILVLDDELTTMDTLLANELAGSAFNMQVVELRQYRCEEVSLSVEQIGDPTLPVRNVKNSRVRSMGLSMRELTFDYGNGMNAVTWSVACYPTVSVIKYAVSLQDG